MRIARHAWFSIKLGLRYRESLWRRVGLYGEIGYGHLINLPRRPFCPGCLISFEDRVQLNILVISEMTHNCYVCVEVCVCVVFLFRRNRICRNLSPCTMNTVIRLTTVRGIEPLAGEPPCLWNSLGMSCMIFARESFTRQLYASWRCERMSDRLAQRFPENRGTWPCGSEFSNLKPSSSKQINSNFTQDHEDFMMGNIGKLSVNLMSTVLTKFSSINKISDQYR